MCVCVGGRGRGQADWARVHTHDGRGRVWSRGVGGGEPGWSSSCLSLPLSESPLPVLSSSSPVRAGVCLCVRVCPRSPGSTGVGQPPGLPEACQGSPRWSPDSHLVSWKPNPEATQACGGSQRHGHPPGEGLGLRGPKSWAAGMQAVRLAG